MTGDVRTEAGRRLLDRIEDAIVAIEAEARAQGALHERLISEGEEAEAASQDTLLREALERIVRINDRDFDAARDIARIALAHADRDGDDR